MSKTVEIQIEKSRGLVEGLRRHVKEMGERGVTNEEINAMELSVKELEAVMPLTEQRIPFTVRYTTEFDDTGRPVKAYGSAALVVEGK